VQRGPVDPVKPFEPIHVPIIAVVVADPQIAQGSPPHRKRRVEDRRMAVERVFVKAPGGHVINVLAHG
jgi:hypothetical protein